MKIFIIGHITPDLDSIVSAVSYAEFLNKSGKYKGSEVIPVRAGEANAETNYIFQKFGVKIPKHIDEFEIEDEDKFILLDHNEESQRAEKVKNEHIIEIVDHHKLNVSFPQPLRVDVRPVGSSSTIVYEMFKESYMEPSKGTSEILLAAILSDTVGLKSSTTTGLDSQIARDIADRYFLNIEKLSFEIFKSKSDISGLSVMDIVKKDFKIFEFSGTKVFIGQVETVEPDKLIGMSKELVQNLEKVKKELEVKYAFLFITDILKINSQGIYSTDEERRILEKAFTSVGQNNTIDIGAKMSRKKDIAPCIEDTLK